MITDYLEDRVEDFEIKFEGKTYSVDAWGRIWFDGDWIQDSEVSDITVREITEDEEIEVKEISKELEESITEIVLDYLIANGGSWEKVC